MIPSDQPHLFSAAASHPGMTGKKNEDRYGVTAFLGEKKGTTPSLLAVLCDGIGGHRAGEVAAEMGVSIITEHVAASDGHQPLPILNEAITLASTAVYEASQADQGRGGMGATCACAWVIADRLYTCNLGDSRIYLLRKGHCLQLSTDHTWIQEAMDAGLITDANNGNHINAHVIRRYLGSPKPPEPDFRLWFFEGEDDQAALDNQGLRLQPKDIVLLCSDGLTDLVSDQEIRETLETVALTDAPEKLIAMANARGGHDNTTIVLLQVPPKGKIVPDKSRKRRFTLGCIAGLAVFSLVVTALLLGWRLRRDGLFLNQTDTEEPSITWTVTMERFEAPLVPGSATTTPMISMNETLTDGAPAGVTTTQPTLTPWPTDTGTP